MPSAFNVHLTDASEDGNDPFPKRWLCLQGVVNNFPLISEWEGTSTTCIPLDRVVESQIKLTQD